MPQQKQGAYGTAPPGVYGASTQVRFPSVTLNRGLRDPRSHHVNCSSIAFNAPLSIPRMGSQQNSGVSSSGGDGAAGVAGGNVPPGAQGGGNIPSAAAALPQVRMLYRCDCHVVQVWL